VIAPSLNPIFCCPEDTDVSPSSSSSSKTVLAAPAFLIVPKAALPPANEKGVDCTAVPNTLAVGDTPKAAKSVTTLRGGEPGMIAGAEDRGREDDGDPYFRSVERADVVG